MAINAGVNQSKIVSFTPLSIPVGVDVTKAVLFAVLGSPNTNPPVWPTVLFPNGVVGIAYSYTWDLYPAASPTTYTVTVDTDNLFSGAGNWATLTSVSSDIGRVTGTPNAVKVYHFTLLATNAYGTASLACTLTVTDSSAGTNAAWVF